MPSKKSDEPAWDVNLEPLMKTVLGKKGVKTKSASEVGKKKVDYFRGKDFKNFLLGSDELLKRKCPLALKACLEDETRTPDDEKDVEIIGAELISKGFIYKAFYKPLNSSSDSKAKKWPDRLTRSPNQSFDVDGFYVVQYEGDKAWSHFLLGCLIAGVLLICMFPAWPLWAKIGIWYLSVIFLTFYFGLLIIRMIFFALFWIVGWDFWIFPNINDEYCGFLDSFRPLYSWDKRSDDLLMLVVRFGSLAIVGLAVQQIAETHSLDDVVDFAKDSYMGVIDWGVDKLMLTGGDTDKKLLPSLDELKQQQADEDSAEQADKKVADVAPDDDDDDEAEAVNVEG